MTPIERFEAGLARLRNNGCESNATVLRVQQDNKKQANVADQRLQEKQAREWQNHQLG